MRKKRAMRRKRKVGFDCVNERAWKLGGLSI
jgi:hypothetical protein